MLKKVWLCMGALLVPSIVMGQVVSENTYLEPVRLTQAIEEDVADEDAAEEEEEDDDLDLDFLDEDITQIRQTQVAAPALSAEVSSVSRSAQPLARTPAAIFVLTNEMIKRSGARNIPDALRLVPGLNVAQIQSHKWAVSARGDSGEFANKMLVQIDGRAIYTPIFAGTYWDSNRVLLEDIDRIEIIRGPGGTVWGANAVNGVINIVTKDASETTGIYADAGGGNHEKVFSDGRIGGTTARGINWRIYAMQNETGPGLNTLGVGGNYDNYRSVKTGFRTDWDVTCCDKFTFQGDISDGESGSLSTTTFQDTETEFYDGNVLARWTHTISDDADWSVQTYWNRMNRESFDNAGVHNSTIRTDIIDLDVQNHFKIGCNHDIVWGFGYRNSDMLVDFITGSNSMNPPRDRYETAGVFVQDTMTLSEDRLYMTAGCKVEYNNFTGCEYQPSMRLVWTPDERKSIWCSVSRAVRVPSFIDRSITFSLGGPLTLNGSPTTDAEVLWAYEAGMRAQPNDYFYWDLACFYNNYDKLVNTSGAGPAFFVENFGRGHSYGAELLATYEMNECWKLRGGYTYLNENRYLPNNPNASWFAVAPGAAPRNSFYAVTSHDINCCTQLDVIARYNDNLATGGGVPAYLTMDARLAWKPYSDVELSVVGRNLLDNTQQEFASDTFLATEVRREVYGMVSFTY